MPLGVDELDPLAVCDGELEELEEDIVRPG
jgi:hypothetical protein